MPKRIDKLTPEQEARMGEWRDKWIRIGLQTGDADWDTFERSIRVAYEKANLPFPNKIVRVQSPMVGAVAAGLANKILQRGAVNDAVRGAVDGAVRGVVHGAVYDAVDGAVRDAVGGAVNDAVYGAVNGAVGNTAVQWHEWLGGQFWAGWWWGSPAFISFFTDVCGLELSPDMQERANAYRGICESVNYVWPNTHFVMVCDRPQIIARDEAGRLHSDQRKAIEYKDGWGLYALDGVVLGEGIWKQIVSQSMAFDEILKIQDADVRAVALKYNKNAIIASGAELLDEHPTAGELFLIKGREINRIVEEPELYFLRMKCPTGRTFVEAVDPSYAKQYPYALHCQAKAWNVPVEIYGQLRREG